MTCTVCGRQERRTQYADSQRQKVNSNSALLVDGKRKKKPLRKLLKLRTQITKQAGLQTEHTVWNEGDCNTEQVKHRA